MTDKHTTQTKRMEQLTTFFETRTLEELRFDLDFLRQYVSYRHYQEGERIPAPPKSQ